MPPLPPSLAFSDELRPWAEALWDALASELRARGFERVRARMALGTEPASWPTRAAAPRADGVRTGPAAPSGGATRPADTELLLGWPRDLDARGRPTSPDLRVLGTPCFRAPGALGPEVVTRVLVRSDLPAFELEDLRGRRFAAPGSPQHPHVAPALELFAPHERASRFFSRTYPCRGVLDALERLTAGSADATVVDAVTQEALRHARPDLLERTRVVAETRLAPGIPLVTSARHGLEERRRIASALVAVIEDPRLDAARAALRLSGIALAVGGGSAVADLQDLAHRV